MTYAVSQVDFSAATAQQQWGSAASSWVEEVFGSMTGASPRVAPFGARGVEAEDLSAGAARTQNRVTSAVRDLRRYATFHRGWDGYDGRIIEADVIERAIALVESMPGRFRRAGTEPSEITPCPISDGRVDVEVACQGRRLIITLETGSDEVGIFYDDRGEPLEGVARWERGDLVRWLRRLTGEDLVSAMVRDAPQHPLGGEALAVSP